MRARALQKNFSSDAYLASANDETLALAMIETRAALAALDDILAPNRTVTCEAVDIDRYKRPVAICRAGGRDIAEAMVRGATPWSESSS